MPAILEREFVGLRRQVLALSAAVEDNLRAAVRAVLERDEALAQRVIEKDREIDRTEVEVEEECLKILALHQPVAIDLRYIVAMLKINHDLERVGDLAVNIAERAASLCALPSVEVPYDLPRLTDRAQYMIARSLDAMIHLNEAQAREIWLSDDEVDQLNREAYRRIVEGLRKHPDHIEQLLSLLSVARQLERIADHATNIAKDVLYMVQGEIFRHRAKQFKLAAAPRPDGGAA